MSFEHAAIAMNHTRATGAVRAVMIGMASHADAETGEAFPGMMKLAQYAGYEGWDAQPVDDSKEARDAARKARGSARRQAIRAVQKLVDLGEITVETNGGGTRKSPEHMRPNLYKIVLTCPPTCDHSAQHRLLTPEQTQERLRKQLGLVDNSQSDPVVTESPRGQRVTPPVVRESPESSINHQTYEDTSLNHKYQHASAQEAAGADGITESYAEWNPGQKIAQAARQMRASDKVKRPDLSKPTTPTGKVPPAPTYPRFTPAPPRPLPEPRTPEEEAAVQVAAQLECPEGFSTGKNRLHWFPGTLAGCARCGTDALDIVTPTLTNLEHTA